MVTDKKEDLINMIIRMRLSQFFKMKSGYMLI